MNKKLKILYILLMFFTAPINSLYAETIKIATLSPEGTYWMEQMRAGAKEIKKQTNGRVKFKFYPGGVMGNDENVLRKIRIGQLQGGAVTITAVWQSTPDVTVYGLPFLFSSFDDAEAIRVNTDSLLRKKIENNGFVNFGFAQGGFGYLMSKQKITNLDDLRRQKSWIPEKSDVGLSVYKNIGVTPTSLPMSDVLTGLQTGLVNTVITSPIAALALQWHTYVNYVVDMPLNYLVAMMIIDKKVFNKLKVADQKVVRKVMGDVYKRIDNKNKTDNVKARNALANQGVKFIQLNANERQDWLKLGDMVIDEMKIKYNYDQKLYNAVMLNKHGMSKK